MPRRRVVAEEAGVITYDVYATDNGELIGEDVDALVARLIIGCLDCPASVLTHEEGSPVDPALLLPA
jgi:hypothetical protein